MIDYHQPHQGDTALKLKMLTIIPVRLQWLSNTVRWLQYWKYWDTNDVTITATKLAAREANILYVVTEFGSKQVSARKILIQRWCETFMAKSSYLNSPLYFL